MSAVPAEQETVESLAEAVNVASDTIDQYLTFIMDNEEYGVDILSVKEIRNWDSATPIPKAPSHVRGVINLRGTIIPIIDLRQCFGMKAIEYGPLTVVLVLQVNAPDRAYREVGIVVDAVSDVYSLEADQIKPAPQMSDKVNANYIRGLANIKGEMVILLEINHLLGQSDLSDLSEVRDVLKQVEKAVH
ncbi:MAG: chemotaxis protein CheW [Pseudomonadales bacterium]|nr:chemotaxis protein CheW [Pseudomonadales bacterium]